MQKPPIAKRFRVWGKFTIPYVDRDGAVERMNSVIIKYNRCADVGGVGQCWQVDAKKRLSRLGKNEPDFKSLTLIVSGSDLTEGCGLIHHSEAVLKSSKQIRICLLIASSLGFCIVSHLPHFITHFVKRYFCLG